jgi:hypothetical protein
MQKPWEIASTVDGWLHLDDSTELSGQKLRPRMSRNTGAGAE